MPHRPRSVILLLALTALAASGCDLLQDLSDRFKTCEDVSVDLVNSQQTRAPVHIAAPGEAFTAENLLASGASRRVGLCLERGDRKTFRAGRDGQVVGVVTCVAGKARYEGTIPSVVWSVLGFSCEDW